jgi:hypothetical protein
VVDHRRSPVCGVSSPSFSTASIHVSRQPRAARHALQATCGTMGAPARQMVTGLAWRHSRRRSTRCASCLNFVFVSVSPRSPRGHHQRADLFERSPQNLPVVLP